MKARFGFVSNSSTTSFTIYGARFRNDEECKELTGLSTEELARERGLQCEAGGPIRWSSPLYVGLCTYSMKEDETLRNFKERVHEALADVPEKLFGMYSESYYNG